MDMSLPNTLLAIISSCLGLYTAILSYKVAKLNKKNAILDQKNSELNQRCIYLTQQYNDLHTEYTQKFDQVIHMQRPEPKQTYKVEHLLRECRPTLLYYLFFLLYFLFGWFVGHFYDIGPIIKSLFQSKMIFYNPAFWGVLLSIVIFLLLPAIPRRRLFKKFPFKFMEISEGNGELLPPAIG